MADPLVPASQNPFLQSMSDWTKGFADTANNLGNIYSSFLNAKANSKLNAQNAYYQNQATQSELNAINARNQTTNMILIAGGLLAVVATGLFIFKAVK